MRITAPGSSFRAVLNPNAPTGILLSGTGLRCRTEASRKPEGWGSEAQVHLLLLQPGLCLAIVRCVLQGHSLTFTRTLRNGNMVSHYTDRDTGISQLSSSPCGDFRLRGPLVPHLQNRDNNTGDSPGAAVSLETRCEAQCLADRLEGSHATGVKAYTVQFCTEL